MQSIDWTQLVTRAQKEIKESTATEVAFAAAEMLVIADQLMSIADSDPAALAGTEQEWRTYRTQVRAWKDGAEGYPNKQSRPQRP